MRKSKSTLYQLISSQYQLSRCSLLALYPVSILYSISSEYQLFISFLSALYKLYISSIFPRSALFQLNIFPVYLSFIFALYQLYSLFTILMLYLKTGCRTVTKRPRKRSHARYVLLLHCLYCLLSLSVTLTTTTSV